VGRPSGYILMQMRICELPETRSGVKNDWIRKYQFQGYTIKYSGFHQMWEVVKKNHKGQGGSVAIRPFRSKAQAEKWVAKQVKSHG